LHLVGQLLNSIHDARTHVYKIPRIILHENKILRLILLQVLRM